MKREHFDAIIADMEARMIEKREYGLRISMRNGEVYEGPHHFLPGAHDVLVIGSYTGRPVYIALPAVATVGEALL
ncbi:hypothetical protein [uncultured Methylobacterium sp.]|jgi:hypothetical protein|uniref:hypothetical protein n=1 Tax=uncultured Methylobacterium sp. TaxID=157278 RepID=UPI00261AAAFB|nr:hypothetical protein [uncultured Methylobacterium sp.]